MRASLTAKAANPVTSPATQYRSMVPSASISRQATVTDAPVGVNSFQRFKGFKSSRGFLTPSSEFAIWFFVESLTPSSPHVLIVGVSTRAAAESAARAGFTVTAIDAFGDLDQHESVRCLSLPRDIGKPFSSAEAARASRRVECDAVVYLSSFENHPKAVATLAAGRSLWGNSPAVLQDVRDPLLVSGVFRRRGFASPRVRTVFDSRQAASVKVSGAWLVKPLKSGGGHGIRVWRHGTGLRRGCYLQEHVEGTPGSVVFVASRGGATPLGVSRQLIGEAAFGAEGYRYCGSILSGAGDTRDRELVDRASALAAVAAEEFQVVGINGIDFIARQGIPHVLEINPRWSASVELAERAYGFSAFSAHAAACADSALLKF